jgi:hypothetical protein
MSRRVRQPACQRPHPTAKQRQSLRWQLSLLQLLQQSKLWHFLSLVNSAEAKNAKA